MEITRDNVQQQSIELANAHDNVLLKWGTGVGKSLAFIKMQESLQPKKVYIIVAETAHIDNWKNDYIKHGKQSLLANVEIFCYASLKKYVDTEVDMICLDEGHHAVTEIRLEHLSSIKVDKIVLLSATIKASQKEILNNTFGKFHEHTVTLKQAISNGILPEPTIYLIPLMFNAEEKTTVEFTRGNSKKRRQVVCEFKDRFNYMKDKKNYPDLHLIINCTYRQKNDYLDAMIEFNKRKYFGSQQIFFKTKWLFTGSERKRFLAETKTEYVKTLLQKVENKRFICFTGSIEQATILSNNTNVIHSKVKDSLKIIDSFNKELISHLFVVDMLKEGQNLNNIEVGIIVQLDGDVGPFIQKAGRVMRAENPVIFIFYYKGTRDEEYLANILTEVDREHVQILTDLADFSFNQ